MTEGQIRSTLSQAGFGGKHQCRSVTDQKNYFIIDVPLAKMPEQGVTVSPLDYTQQQLESALQKAYPNQYKVELTTGFGSQSGQEFKTLALLVVLLASGAILVYLWFRFELVFGVAAVVALLHDVLIVVLLCTLIGVQINLDVVAALMVLLGFSVNDTIVIFDRVRENARNSFGKDFGTICNEAMNQTLSGPLITSGTVFLAVLALYPARRRGPAAVRHRLPARHDHRHLFVGLHCRASGLHLEQADE